MKKFEEEILCHNPHTPQINEFSKKYKRNISDLFEWQKKKNERTEMIYEQTYGKEKKHLFSNKSTKNIKNLILDKKDESNINSYNDITSINNIK